MSMASTKSIVSNERGAALIMSLLVLVLVTMIGMSMLTTSGMEVRMAGSERSYKQDFYLTESALAEGAQLLENNRASLGDPVFTGGLPWLTTPTAIDAWVAANGGADRDQYMATEGLMNGQAATLPGPLFNAVYEGIPPGSNLDMSGTRDRLYSMYGRQQTNATRIMIKTAYLTNW